MPHISVVIPVWNREEWIASAVSSVLEQSYCDYELIIVDDGSTDHTLKVLEDSLSHTSKTAKKSIQIHSMKRNQGVSKARNTGIKLGNSEWVAFLDSDDRWHPQKLQRQKDYLRLHPEYKVCFTEEVWIRNGRRVNPKQKHQKQGGQIFQASLKLCMMAASTTMIHRDVFEQCGVFDESLTVCEDYDLWLRIAARYSVALIHEQLMTRYGGHADQLSAHSWGNDRYRVRSLQKILKTIPLSKDDQQAAIAVLLQKSRILSQGFLKRNKQEEAEYYQNIIREWSVVS